jgi:tetratricopeptide (TPR) repeat protein
MTKEAEPGQEPTPPHPAERILRQADQLVRLGKLTEAASMIRQAAEIYAAADQTDDEARCLVLAATAARLGGAASAAQTDAAAAVRAAPAQSSAAAQAAAELAESLLAAGRPIAAIEEYTSAIDRLPSGVTQASARAVLLRKRGLAHALADHPDVAIDDLEAAAGLFSSSGRPRACRAVLVEAATLATERATPERGSRLRQRARTAAERAADHDAQSDLDLLDARQAVTRGDLESAIELAVRARQHALDAVAAVKYLSAAIALAELHDLHGEREAAYEALSTAWATLGDLMGSDAARTVIQPRLEILLERWGAQDFRAVKAGFEARRRAGLSIL